MKTLIIFFPSIESGGVEKNFYYLLSYFCKKFSKIIVITSSKVNKNSYPNKIHFLLFFEISLTFLIKGSFDILYVF